MNQRGVLLFVTWGVLIVVGMFTYAYLKRSEQMTRTPNSPILDLNQNSDVVVPTPSLNIEQITVTEYYDGVSWTFAGEVDMLTPCDQLSVDAIIQESFPEQVTIALSVSTADHMCAQVITPQRFELPVTVSKDATFSATLDGRTIELNRVPAQKGTVPDSFSTPTNNN
jgi:hypothetical protein